MKYPINKEATLLALFARELHSEKKETRRHTLSYHRGWFYIDGKEGTKRPWLLTEASQLNKQGATGVRFTKGKLENFMLVDKNGTPI